eukprot:CAMPEP_0119557148 /NCGR_PEP_ID=MMETSP1352-20130426/8897_1 /TAXON_ID=265584 /ORGANISM="Stauroneis constricta, Strain CCMP1120" /LENGTH=332 /DNA_ID=CAMNT_0007604201 /DNA_START=175 /DNA_END=1173 /DNA_ORIENTATION=+
MNGSQVNDLHAIGGNLHVVPPPPMPAAAAAAAEMSTAQQTLLQQQQSVAAAAAAAVSEPFPGNLSSVDGIHHSIQAWDQIGELTSELGVSMIVRQASVICERFVAEEDRPAVGHQHAADGIDNNMILLPPINGNMAMASASAANSRPKKRIKLSPRTAVVSQQQQQRHQDQGQVEPANNYNDDDDDDDVGSDTVSPILAPVAPPDHAPPRDIADGPSSVVATISCDENSQGSASGSDSGDLSNHDLQLQQQQQHNNLPYARVPVISESLSRQIDRMSRMSRLMMVLEQTRSALRQEMIDMIGDELDQDQDDDDDHYSIYATSDEEDDIDDEE